MSKRGTDNACVFQEPGDNGASVLVGDIVGRDLRDVN